MVSSPDSQTVVQHDDDRADHTICIDDADEDPDAEPDGRPQPDAVPQTVGRYTIEGLLGAGGMGAVFRGWDPTLDRAVAVKLIHTRRVRRANDDDRARLIREAQALAALSHPNVVNVFEAGSHDDAVFVAMELVDGPTLTAWTRERATGWESIVRMYIQAGRGLCAAHQRGIVHRDFKPANVLVGEDGRARVLDFGLATLDERYSSASQDPSVESSGALPLDVLSAELTAHDTVVGTPAYMAPEQHLRDPVTAAADQFSFCVALWAALVGVPPYPGRTLAEIRASLTSRVRSPVPDDLPVPRRVLSLLDRGLAIEVEARWPSLDELLDRLEAVLRGPRRWPWAVGAAALLTGGLVWGLAPEPDVRCDPSADGVVPWNEGARAQLSQMFEGSGQAEVEAAWPSVKSTLDEHARAWSEGYVQVCEGGIGEAGDQLTFDLRMGCLHQQRDAMATVLEVLGASDAEQLRRAGDAVAQLPPVDACLEAARGDPSVALPDDPSEQARASEVRAQLVGVKALIASGRRDDAEREASAAVDAARALHFMPVLVEAEIRQGIALSRLGQPQAAEPLLTQAFWRASDLDYAEAGSEAAIELAWQVGYLQGRHQEGIEWVRHFESMARRMGSDPTYNTAAVLGPIYFDAQQFERARPYLETLRDRELARGQDTYDAAVARMNFGNLLIELAEFERADEEFGQAQRVLDALFPEGHPDLALALINRATVVSTYRRDSVQAEALLRRGIEMSRRWSGEEHPATALGLMLLGSQLSIDGQHEEAIQTLERSRAAYSAGSVSERLQVDHELADAHQRAGHPEQAERRWQTLLARARDELPADHTVIAQARAGLAEVALARGQIEQSRRYYEQAIAGIEALPLDALPIRLALGAMLVEHGQPQDGRAILERWHRWAQDKFGDDHEVTLDARVHLAMALARTEQPDEAKAMLTALVERGSEPPMTESLHQKAKAELARLE